MAFSSVVLFRTVIGEKWVSGGTWNGNDGGAVTTGELDTHLAYIETLQLTHTGNGVKANAPSVDETLPLDAGIATIDFDSGTSGCWLAVGRMM